MTAEKLSLAVRRLPVKERNVEEDDARVIAAVGSPNVDTGQGWLRDMEWNDPVTWEQAMEIGKRVLALEGFEGVGLRVEVAPWPEDVAVESVNKDRPGALGPHAGPEISDEPHFGFRAHDSRASWRSTRSSRWERWSSGCWRTSRTGSSSARG